MALFAAGKLEHAIEVAYQVWQESREAFGPEDTRTFEAEVLWLSARIHNRSAAELPYENLTRRLLAIKEKSIERWEIPYEMTWRFGKPAKEWPNTKHIILTHVSHPNYFHGIYSSDLADHLETLRGERICVVIMVTYDAIGESKSHNIIEIGGMTRWKSQNSYGGVRGNQRDFPSPWDQMNQQNVQCLSGAINR